MGNTIALPANDVITLIQRGNQYGVEVDGPDAVIGFSRSNTVGDQPDESRRASMLPSELHSLRGGTDLMSQLELGALIVREYEPAIDFFVNVLLFELVEHVPSLTNDGRPKRWVVVRPVGGHTGILLARADGERQVLAVGEQFADRVGFFLRVDDFEKPRARMSAAGVRSVTAARVEHTDRWRYSWISRETVGTSLVARLAPDR